MISQRRTRDEWNLLIAMHRGWYPLVDNQAFRRPGPPPRDPSPDGRPPDTRHPVEKAVEHLAKAFPLKTPEWAAWSATMRPARLDGTWAISATQLGKGRSTAAWWSSAVAAPTSSRPRSRSSTHARASGRRGPVRRSSTPGSSGAAARREAGDGQRAARGDVRRSRLAHDRGALVQRRATTRSGSTSR